MSKPDMAAFRRAKPQTDGVGAEPVDTDRRRAGGGLGGLAALDEGAGGDAEVVTLSVVERPAPELGTEPPAGVPAVPEVGETPASAQEPADQPAVRKIGARIPETLYLTLREHADARGLFFDEVLADAMRSCGDAVVAALAARPGATRRRKGLRTDVTSFHLRLDDASELDRLKAAIPQVNTSRLITDLLEAYFSGAEPANAVTLAGADGI